MKIAAPSAKTLGLFAGLVALAVASRFLHLEQPNMSAVAACALFAGFLFRSRVAAALVPLTAMVISDAIIGGHVPGVMVAIYASLVLPIFLAPLLKTGRNPLRIGAAALLGSVAFFLITNGAHWVFTDMYAHTAAGLIECYAQALPFFRYTVQGDVAYSAILFAGFTVATLPTVRRAPATPSTATLA